MFTKTLLVPKDSSEYHHSRTALRRVLLALFATGLAFVTLLPQGVSRAVEPVAQLVRIGVRDGAGNPMMGVSILIKIDEPPVLEDDDKCLTGEDGTCIVQLVPRTYRIQFIYGWRDWPFTPVEEQEVFRITISEGNEIQYYPFAVGERGGQLVPVWDMSADPSQPPQPFLPSFSDKDPLAEIYLGPLNSDFAGTAQPGSSIAASNPTPTIQAVVDELAPGVAAAPATAIPTPATDAGGSEPGDKWMLRMLFGLLIILALIAMVIVLIFVIAHRPKRKAR
jgi:hypothetical protein